MQRRRRTSDLLRNRHYCRPARWIILLVIQHHPDRSCANLRCKFVRCLVHKGSFYSRVGASGNPGAVQTEAEFKPVRAWAGVAVLIIFSLMSYIDRQIVSLLVDPIKDDLLLSDIQISLGSGLIN